MTETAEPNAIGPFVVLRKLGEGGMGIVYAGYDLALDRKVALKLIRRQLLDRSHVRARMLREAQAMARLSHPNVVQVYQVGEHGDEIYVAMEYVEGQTLTSWLLAEPRPWPTILRTMIAAGRGLAAAHAAGLVHRDFKPDNLLVGKDGRPCVLDFGLVHAEGASAAPLGVDVRASGGSLLSLSRISTLSANAGADASGDRPDPVRLTAAGKILGTPAYMSPEQHFGDEVGPASDQFSFGVTLYEALYGVRPFPGETWADIKREIRRAEVPPPPRDSAVPRRIFRIVARSLEPAPDRRWPSLTDMLDALERDPRRAFLRAAGVAAIAGAAAAGSYAVALARGGAAGQCTGAALELAGVWDDARASAAERAFAASRSPLATATWERVRGRLDAYAAAWSDGRTQACEAHAKGTQSTGLFDRRTACLARRRTHLAALVDTFAAADRSVVENAVQAAAALPSLESCADVDALLAALAPPDDPETAAEVEAQRGRLARVAALESTGLYAAGLALAREVRAASQSMHYPPLAAEAALSEGSLLLALGRPDEAEAALTDALGLGVLHGLDAIAAEAAAKRIFVIGDNQGRRAAALEGEPVALALAERARDGGRIAALLHNNLGVVHDRDGSFERARENYRRAIELMTRSLGPSDPLLAIAHHNLGALLDQRRHYDQAREHFERALALFSEQLGDQHPNLSFPLGSLADLDALRGDHAAAAARYQRSLALMEATYGVEHPHLMHPLVGLGKVRAATGATDVAVAHLRRAVALGERDGAPNEHHAEALAALAELQERDEAVALLARAVAVYEALGGPEHPQIAALALRAGQLAGEPAAARRWLERAWNFGTGPSDQAEIRARAALELAAADPTRACALLDAAADLPADLRPRADDLRARACGAPR